MAVQNSDLLLVERGGVLYRATTQELANFISSVLGTSEFQVADIAARNALDTSGELTVGDIIMVDDASADSTVSAGWAAYQYLSTGVYRKIAEEESMDIVINTNDLGLSLSASTVTITNNNGTDATIPSASNTQAGAMPASDKVKIDNITVTAAVDLDALETERHVPSSTSGASTTNPISIAANQVISFSISSLSPAP